MSTKILLLLVVSTLAVLLTACSGPSTTVPTAQTLALPATLTAVPTAPPTATVFPVATAVSATKVPLDCSVSIGTPIQTSGRLNVYADPDKRFTIPIPTNWKAESTPDFVRLCDPQGEIKAFALVVPATITAQGIGKAWAQIAPGFSLSVLRSTQGASAEGVDETRYVVYDAGTERQTQAMGQRVDDKVYVLLIDGAKSAFTRRSAQVNILQTGMSIAGLPKVDLSAVRPRALTPEMLGELESYIVDTMRDFQVPGLEVAVVQDGKVVMLKGLGVLEADKSDPVTPDTLMLVGSTSKSMTTMMMATLIDDGRMRWDTPAIRLLPSFAVSDPRLSEKITMQHLVCACTGVPRRDVEIDFNKLRYTAADIVASLKTFELYTDFGEAFQYSNQMVAAGGYIAAAAGSGRTDHLYDDYVAQMQTRVLDPISMPSTTYSFDRALSVNHATPHYRTLYEEVVPAPLDLERIVIPLGPAGGAWSNARDMSRYLLTLMSQGVDPEGRRVVSAGNLQATWQPQVQVTAQTSYGLGWFIDDYKGVRLIHHGGNTYGFTTDLAFLPQHGLGILTITNVRASNALNQAIRFRLFEIAYGLPKEHDSALRGVLRADREEAAGWLANLQPAVDRATVEPFLGAYTNPALGNVLLVYENGKLYLTAEGLRQELRTKADKSGQVTFWGFTDPFWGDEFKLEQDAASGKRKISVTVASETYTFWSR